MTRKSPIFHKVRPHTRAGVHVGRYERGEGEAPRQVIGAQSLRRGAETYRVNINYADEEAFAAKGARYPTSHGARTEHLTVKARNYLDAMDQGLARGGEGTPVSVTMRRL